MEWEHGPTSHSGTMMHVIGQRSWESIRPLASLASKAHRALYRILSEPSEEIENSDFPPPDLSGLAILFIVEGSNSKFMVLVKNEPDDNMEHFEPEVTWVEMMPKK